MDHHYYLLDEVQVIFWKLQFLFFFVLVVLLIAATAFFQYQYYQADKMIVLGGISILIYLPLLYFIKEMRSAKSVQDYDFLVKLLNMVFISLLFAMTSLKYVIPYALI